MSLNRFAKRRDANEPELISIARKLGAHCERTDKPLDWLIGWRGRWIPTEIKTGEKEGHKNEFKPDQQRFMRDCEERGLQFWVWRYDTDVIASLNRDMT